MSTNMTHGAKPGRAAPAFSEIDRATTALHSISPDLPRDEWVKTCMAAKDAGISFEAFDDWSAGGSTYNPHACRSTWNSAKPGKGVSVGTLFYLAKVHGWKDSVSYSPAPRPIQAPVSTPEPLAPGMSAAEIWARCKAATISHPYAASKKAPVQGLAGLRVLPAGDTLEIGGESMAGALVVPAYRPDDSLATLQLIALPDVAARLKARNRSGKLNLARHHFDDAYFTVGQIVPGGLIYIVEGIGAAWACWQASSATGAAAVVTFGAYRTRTVAKQLRQRDPAAKLVICPDVGKEAAAALVADEVGAAVVNMPADFGDNADVADLAAREGTDVLADLLDTASFPSTNNHSSAMTDDYSADSFNPMPEFEGVEGLVEPVPVVAPVHALAKYVQIGEKPKAVRWVIPGFIGHGVTIIAGAHGAGKTTALLPLAMVAAGLHSADNVLAPKHWRHVVYIVEDAEQAQRIISGVVAYGRMGINPDDVAERLHIVEAKRLPPSEVAKVGKTYREDFTRTVNGVDILPLVVIDTKAATLELQNENDNSEASAAMAALKQGFDGLPVWLVGHVAKQSIGATKDMTLRGGSAFEADANQVLYLVQEGETRYLTRGKTRFDAKWKELQIVSDSAVVLAEDEFGDHEEVTLRWGTCCPPELTRQQSKEQHQEQSEKEATGVLRDAILAAVDSAHADGLPLNRKGVKGKVSGNSVKIFDTIQNLLSEGWLHEVDVPAHERQRNRPSFLVKLSTPEHEAYRETGELPAAKLVIPQSWKKQAN